MKTRFALLVLVFGASYMAQAQYDTSTPEKFIESLGKVGAGPASENPIPFFYEKTSSDAISLYDANGASALSNFQKFKSALLADYGSRVAGLEENKIEMYVDSDRMETLSFSLRGSLIGPQLKQRTPQDYVFLSATLPNDQQVVTITTKMLGRETKVEVKNFGGSYKMFMDEKNLTTLANLAKFFDESNKLFLEWLKFMNDKKLNDDNFEATLTQWNSDFMTVAASLN